MQVYTPALDRRYAWLSFHLLELLYGVVPPCLALRILKGEFRWVKVRIVVFEPEADRSIVAILDELHELGLRDIIQ
jgi:hypothetical protein